MNKAEELFEKMSGRKAVSCNKLEEGLSNDTFLINNDYVVRIRKENSDKYYNLKLERDIALRMAEMGLSETIITFSPLDGSKISSYISNSHRLSYPYLDDEFKAIARSIYALHSANLNTKINFDMFERFKYYKEESHVSLNSHHEERLIKELQDELKDEKMVLCHNDLVRGNILLKDGYAVLIDWEFASMNYSSFDIASFLSENNIDDNDLIRDFISYVEIEKKDDKKYFNMIKKLMEFENYLWFYWAMMKYRQTNDKRFIEIANSKKDAL